MKYMVTTNKKSTRDIQEIKRKKFKHNTIEIHQHTRDQENKKGTEKHYKTRK